MIEQNRQTTLRETLIAAAALSLGWWLHARPVHAAAAPAPDVSFQFGSIGPQSALTLYNPADHTLTVYQGATTGNSQVNCTFQYRITRPGAPVERRNCQPGALLP